eukprot:364253-Chlamydomonas_euryale.AAC.15
MLPTVPGSRHTSRSQGQVHMERTQPGCACAGGFGRACIVPPPLPPPRPHRDSAPCTANANKRCAVRALLIFMRFLNNLPAHLVADCSTHPSIPEAPNHRCPPRTPPPCPPLASKGAFSVLFT